MAEVFKNARLLVTDSYTTAYTVPALTTSIVIGLQVANVDGTNAADISAQWLDSSNSNAATRICHTVSVPADAALGLLSGKLVLEAGDAIQALASANGDLELTVSVLELS
jgi:hypothetical protein